MKEWHAIFFILIISLVGLWESLKPYRAYGATKVNEVISSGTYSGVTVTTGTTIRVDNYLSGASGNIIDPRVGFKIQNLDSADDIYCGFNTDVSTDTATDQIGERLDPDDIVVVNGDRTVEYHCQAVDAAGASGVVISLQQIARE